jgi:predicted N-acetyltransferase YhbS
MEIAVDNTPAGNVAGFIIAAETTVDVAAREALLDRAMGSGRKRKSSEKLRRGRKPSEGLAFAARDASGVVIGTVRLWDVAFASVPSFGRQAGHLLSVGEKEPGATLAPSSLQRGEGGSRSEPDEGPSKTALLLGPLAVDPAHAGAGVGSALMRHAIMEATRLGHGAILLVGDAAYYERFGFSAEKTSRLAMPGPYERHRFLALELKPGALDGACGTLRANGRRMKGAAARLAA